MMTNEEKELKHLIDLLKTVNKEQKRMQKLSAKLRDVDFRQVTQKRTEKMNADLNWACMDLDIAKVIFARAFKEFILDVGTHEREYNPSAFHKYRH